MKMRAFAALTVLAAGCGPVVDGDEPIAEEFERAGPGATCPDGSQGVSVTLRAGVTVPVGNTYDVWIDQANPSVNNFGSTSCYADGDTGSGNDLSCLLKWEVSFAIPAGKTVLDAWLEFYVVGTSAQTYGIYFLARSWDPSVATWVTAKTKIFWQLAGAKGALDRSPSLFAKLYGGSPAGANILPIVSEALPMVQNWVNNPKSNFGLIMAHETQTDAVRIRGQSSATPSERPGLGIRYCP